MNVFSDLTTPEVHWCVLQTRVPWALQIVPGHCRVLCLLSDENGNFCPKKMPWTHAHQTLTKQIHEQFVQFPSSETDWPTNVWYSCPTSSMRWNNIRTWSVYIFFDLGIYRFCHIVTSETSFMRLLKVPLHTNTIFRKNFGQYFFPAPNGLITMDNTRLVNTIPCFNIVSSELSIRNNWIGFYRLCLYLCSTQSYQILK